MEILNIRKDDTKQGFYIGRQTKKRNQSALANPFYLRNEQERELIVDCAYRKWLWFKLNNESKHIQIAYKYNLEISYKWQDPKVIDVIKELLLIYRNQYNLLCYCSPKKCHGEIILNASNWCFNNFESLSQSLYKQGVNIRNLKYLIERYK